MKYLSIIFLISTIFTNIFAYESSKYILITKTSKQSDLRGIKSKLKSLNIEMRVRKSKSTYYIYSKKYKSSRSAKYALKNIKYYFPSAHIATNQTKSSNIYVALALGTTTINESTDNDIKNSDISYALEAGYIFNKNIFASINYLNSSTQDLTMHNAYLSLNYKKDIRKNIYLYGGLLGGYSTLELDGFSNTQASSSMLVGGQMGAVYNFYRGLGTFIAYQGIFLEHLIELQTISSSAEFNLLHNLQVGMRYRF